MANPRYQLKNAVFCPSLQCTLSKNCKSLNNNNLQTGQKGDYKPAYKEFQKSPEDQLQNMPQDMAVELAEIVAVWHDLPVYIKAAIQALVQTAIQGDS